MWISPLENRVFWKAMVKLGEDYHSSSFISTKIKVRHIN